MTNYLPLPGSLDFYTAFLDAGIMTGGPVSDWLGPYAGVNTITIDPSLGGGVSTWRINTSAQADITIAISGTLAYTIFPGQRIRFLINGGAWKNTLTLPANFRLKRNRKLYCAPNSYSWIEFVYDPVTNKWDEAGRGSSAATGSLISGTWQTLTPAAGWAAYGSGFQRPEYMVDEQGFINFRGLLTTAAGAAASAAMFTLPAALGYPTVGNGDLFALVAYDAVPATIKLFSATISNAGVGVIGQAISAGSFVSLSAIRYSLDA